MAREDFRELELFLAGERPDWRCRRRLQARASPRRRSERPCTTRAEMSPGRFSDRDRLSASGFCESFHLVFYYYTFTREYLSPWDRAERHGPNRAF